ncbi:MAG: tetratricopeptide repeat protein [Planctomycetes bacterium]|nr:tetratricopeptide repeat protein [Planctomycetota bacterium]
MALLPACGGDDPAKTPVTPRSTERGGAKGAEGALEAGASSAMLAYEMGLQHLQKGEVEKAETEFGRALQLDPKMAEACFELGKLKVQQSSQQVWSKSRDLDVLGEGVALLAKACELEPANDQYLFHLGRAHYLKDDLDGARLHLGKAVELNPKLVGGWKALGRAQVDAGETEAGRDSYLRALELNPNDAAAHFLLGQALEVLSDLAGARVAYEKSVALEPSEYEVYGRLSQVCGKLGDAEGEAKANAGRQQWVAFDEQLTRRQKAVNQNPSDGAALRRLGEMYLEIGDWEKAQGLFKGAILIDRRDWRAHLWRGVALRHMKEKGAIDHLKEAEFLAPDVLDPKLELLRLYAERRDDANLDALLRAVEGEAAADGNSLFTLGEVCREVGREEDAKRLFAKAAALGVTEAPANQVMAEGADEELGESEEE